MTTTKPAARKRASKALAVAGTQETWTPAQVTALRTAGFDAPRRELDLLFHRSKITGLDPLLGHLYMTTDERGLWQIRTTISGLLTAARRAAIASGDTLAIGEPKWAGTDGVWRDVWADSQPPVAAQVTVERGGDAFTSTVLFAEYAVFQEETGRLNRTWLKRPAGQLAKCAKAAALRDGFPDQLAGLYTDDEMHHVTNPGGDVVVGTTDPAVGLDDLLAADEE